MLNDLSALLDLLRSKGVTRARLEPMSLPSPFSVIDVTFGPATAAAQDAAPAVVETEASQGDSDTCRCGHGLAEHANGLCLYGCDVEQCAPEE